MAANYNIKGLKRLEKALELLGDRTTKKVLKGALRDASKPIVKEVKRKLPKKTGRLRKTVGVQVDRYGRLKIGYRKTKKHFGFIGELLEKGTKSHVITVKKKDRRRGRRAITTPFGAKDNVRVKGIKATPTLQPAMESRYRQGILVFKKRVNERIIIESIKQAKAFR